MTELSTPEGALLKSEYCQYKSGCLHQLLHFQCIKMALICIVDFFGHTLIIICSDILLTDIITVFKIICSGNFTFRFSHP